MWWRSGEMTQRILLEFDALDKYSRDLLAKHAKKQAWSYLHGLHPPHIPMAFDSGLDGDQGREGKSASSKLPLETESAAASSPRNIIFTDYAKSFIRPFTAAADRSLQKERKSKKVEKSRCVSATRRRNWQSEVESVTKLGTLCTEESNLPILGLQDVSFVSPRSPPLMGGSMELKHQSRQRDTNMDRVSLSIDDELMKSDVKIITAREKTLGAPFETAMDTKPGMYQKENTVVFFSTLSDLQKHVPAKQIHFSSSRWPTDSTRSAMGASIVPQNNTIYTKDLIHNKHTMSPPSTLKNQTNKRLWSANVKLNIQFLSEDGTKQKVELAREEKTPTDRQIGYRELKKTLQESQPWPKSVLVGEERAELAQVGMVINGINPKKTTDNRPGFHSRPQQASKPSGSSSARLPRPRSVAVMQRWSYITISKPLSPPGHQQDFPELGSLVPVVAPHLVHDTPRSGRRSKNSLKTLTTRPVILEARRGRQSSVPEEIHPQVAEIQTHQAEADPREDSRTEEGENVSPHTINSSPSSTILGNPEMKSPVHESSGEQVKKSPVFTIHHSAIPIISIPTAQTDTSE